MRSAIVRFPASQYVSTCFEPRDQAGSGSMHLSLALVTIILLPDFVPSIALLMLISLPGRVL